MMDGDLRLRKLAANLTREQSAFLLSLPATGTRHWPNGMTADELRGLRGFGMLALTTSSYGHDGIYHALSPDGAAVRKILIDSDPRQSAGDGAPPAGTSAGGASVQDELP